MSATVRLMLVLMKEPYQFLMACWNTLHSLLLLPDLISKAKTINCLLTVWKKCFVYVLQKKEALPFISMGQTCGMGRHALVYAGVAYFTAGYAFFERNRAFFSEAIQGSNMWYGKAYIGIGSGCLFNSRQCLFKEKQSLFLQRQCLFGQGHAVFPNSQDLFTPSNPKALPLVPKVLAFSSMARPLSLLVPHSQCLLCRRQFLLPSWQGLFWLNTPHAMPLNLIARHFYNLCRRHCLFLQSGNVFENRM